MTFGVLVWSSAPYGLLCGKGGQFRLSDFRFLPDQGNQEIQDLSKNEYARQQEDCPHPLLHPEGLPEVCKPTPPRRILPVVFFLTPELIPNPAKSHIIHELKATYPAMSGIRCALVSTPRAYQRPAVASLSTIPAHLSCHSASA